MTVKLVKRNQQVATTEKVAPPPSATQLFLNAQGWIEEFKARKARTNQSLISMLKRG